MREKENNIQEIEIPTAKAVDEVIDDIVKRAFPQRQSVFSYIWELYKKIGLRFLLHDMQYMAVIVVLLYFVVFITAFFQSEIQGAEIGVRVMILTPVTFHLPMLLFVQNEKDKHFFETQMTCKYTIRHILALKLILVSILSVSMNFLWCIVLLKRIDFLEILHLFFMAVTSLGIYSVCYMWLLTGTGEKWIPAVSQTGLFLIWALINGLMYRFFPTLYRLLTIQLPVVYHLIVWVLIGVVGSRCLTKYFEMSRRGFVSC